MAVEQPPAHRHARLQRGFNVVLDGIVRRTIVVAGRAWDAYLMWVYAGVAIGTAVIFALSARGPVSLPVMTVVVAMVAALSLALFKSTKILGRSYRVLNWAKKGVYHFQIVALIFTVAFLLVMREPILAYLDVLVVGMLVYQAFGRIGCLMAGCCHGRPSAWGVRYGLEHAQTKYPYFVKGVRLFPVQLIESLWLFAMAAVSVAILVKNQPAGDNVSWYIVGYGAGRFVFEFLRGDMGRVFVRGFSEPQWTALLLTAAVTGLELAEVLSFHWWHAGAFLVMSGVAALRTYMRRARGGILQGLLHPDEFEQVHEAMDQILTEANLLPLEPLGSRDREASGVYLPRHRYRRPGPLPKT